jgi:hypothetical protein
MDKVADVVDQAPMRVYEVATFYSMFNRFATVLLSSDPLVRVARPRRL